MEGVVHKRVIAALLFGLMILFAGGTAARLIKREYSFLPLILHDPSHPICPTSHHPSSLLITSTAVPKPGSTPKPTPMPTVTPTPIPWCVTVPVLADIINEDNSNAYFIRWSFVTWAVRYRLEVNRNNTGWTADYEGPANGITKLHMAGGQYCYRVSASNGVAYTDPSAEKCTIVSSDSLPNK